MASLGLQPPDAVRVARAICPLTSRLQDSFGGVESGLSSCKQPLGKPASGFGYPLAKVLPALGGRRGGLKMNVLSRVALALSVVALCGGPAAAQLWCPSSACITSADGQAYRLVYQTVYDQQEVTAYRIEYETVCEEQQVTTYRPVWETEIRECRYTVARPVMETSTREERYMVCRPLWETQMRDCSYNRVRYVQETAEREERYTVCRPVWETCQRQECYTVRRPVYETAYRTECQTVMRPVTTCRTEYVDQGCLAEQMVFKPSLPKTRLRWVSGGSTIDPATGAAVYHPPGLYWEQTPRGTYEVQRVWQPNVVARQVPQTTYVPQTVSRQVPVQVCRYQEEQVCRTVPYQVCRMVQEEQVRRVPYTVCRQVVDRVEQQVPVQVCRWVNEERVQQIPVTTCQMVYEQRVEKVPYRVCRMEAVQETVRVPRCVEKRIPITYTCRVPRVVCYRVAVDPCGVPLQDYPPATVTGPPVEKQPTPAAKQNGEAGKTPVLGPGEGDEQQPLTEPKVEMPEKADSESRTPAPSSDVFGPKKDAST